MEELLRKSVEVTPRGSIKFFTNNSNILEKTKSNAKSISTNSRTSTRQSRAASSNSSVGHAQVIEDWINKKSLKRLQERNSAESYNTRQMYMTVLNNEDTFVKEIDEFIKDHELLNTRRKELQHKRWHEQVYEPTRRQVEKTIESNFDQLDTVKRKEYLKYLDYRNKKGDVFLDIIAEDEYDPLILMSSKSPVCLQARTPKLTDPLLLQEKQRIDEYKIKVQCLTGKKISDKEITQKWLPSPPLVPLGRHGTHCSTWLEMPLKQIESPVRIRSRKRMKGCVNKMSFDFDSWGDLHTVNQKQVEKELNLQRKKRFPIPDTFAKGNHWIEFPEKQVQPIKEHVRFSLPETNTQNSTTALPPITSSS